MTNQLITIDTEDGSGTLVGDVNRPVTFSTGLGNDPSDDTLYGVTTEGVGVSSLLVTYSKRDGSTTSVGDTMVGAIIGLAFDASGQLWGIDGNNEELIRINKTNGDTTVVGAGGLLAFSSIGGFDIARSGRYWAVNRNGSDQQLIEISPLDGSPANLGNITGFTGTGIITGLASVPEPTNQMLLLACGLVSQLVRKRPFPR